MSGARGLLSRRTGADADAARARRIERALALVERFVFDLGLLIAGEATELHDYVAASAVKRLEESVRPALEAGAMTRPNFGEYAQVRLEGDLLDLSLPVSTVVDFDDRSLRVGDDGIISVPRRRRIRLLLLLDPALTSVLDHHLELAGPP